MSLSAYERRMLRAALSEKSLLSLEECAECLPGRQEDAVMFLKRHVTPYGRIGEIDVYCWGEVIAAVHDVTAGQNVPHDRGEPRTAPPPGPIASWREVAAAVGVDEDTVHRWRAKTMDQTPPVFPSAEAAQTWWKRVRYDVRERAPRPRAPRGTRAATTGTTLAALEAKNRR